jgi:hypothetical protein
VVFYLCFHFFFGRSCFQLTKNGFISFFIKKISYAST